MSAVEADGVATRDPDLILARLHLRLGSLALARAELETLAGRDALDADGLVDLAEARWRTGDIAGAGEAAVAALNDEEGPLLALVVAAEAAAARGRPTEARRLADKAMSAAGGTIDALFAGMPRAAVWPPDAAAPPPSPTTMFDPERRVSSLVNRHPRPHEDSPGGNALAAAEAQAGAEAEAILRRDADAATIGLWEAGGEGPDSGAASDLDAEFEVERAYGGGDELPAADAELELGRAALEAIDTDEAALRLGLVLRITPALAPAVLDLVAGRSEPGLAVVRGDAYRIVGHELEARRAYIEAARGRGPWQPPGPDDDAAPDPPDSDPDHPDHPPEGDPA